ncbi:MAG TPA: hypothetical protein DCF68_03990 [Cyanothece sp. UBA12306]|nr:hypothetical protein [Cyanothece sp. UBA12306]
MNNTRNLSLDLQQETEQIYQARSKLQKHWSRELRICKLGYDKNINCDQDGTFVYLFLKAFHSVNQEKIRLLALTGQLFANSLVLCDEIIDESSLGFDISSILGLQAMQFESYHLLYQIFPPNTVFWSRFREYLSQYTQACLQEYYFKSGKLPWTEYTETAAIQSIKDKTGVAKTAIAGLVELAQDDTYLKPLEESISNFYVANQMLDDLVDWKEDLKLAIPSLLLSRLIDESPRNKSQEELEKLDKTLAYDIYYKEHAHYVLKLALKYLDEAEVLKTKLPDLLWWNITDKLRHKCQALIQDIEQIVNNNLQRVHQQTKFNLTLSPAQSKWQKLAWDGLIFIVKQWQRGFGEARHIMEFAQEQGFSSSQEYQYGDIFQRALIADVLCDFNEALEGSIEPIIEDEINYLLSRQRKTGFGGWSYFPDLLELSPDADDLAQIMQVLVRYGDDKKVKKYCEIPLGILLKDCCYSDGSFETWIIPKNQRNSEQEKQAYWAKNAWGTGPDNDVIANLLYGLYLYNSFRFADEIERGINYIESQQKSDGSWLSSWYHGPYYGTYVCLRLLTAVKPNSPAILKGLNFLESHQLNDGGWGLEDYSDPLSTALALLGLSVIKRKNLTKHNVGNLATKALTSLEHYQQPDQSWPNCLFIRMDLGRAEGKVYQVLSYGSRTLTTTFVMKACLDWHQLIHNKKSLGEVKLPQSLVT